VIEVASRGTESRVIPFALISVLVAAFSVRLGVRLAFGEDYFWTSSYSDYYALAESVLSGKGLCFETTCAWWPPLYPLFLALTALFGKHYLLIVIPQALIGTGTVLLAFLIGREIFGARVGLIASIITAFYPYYVMHDTALQETGITTFFVALSVWLLLRASRLDRTRHLFLAGLALGAIALTRASTAPFIPLALIWAAWIGAPGNIKKRLRNAAVIVLALTLTVGPWLIRTWRVSGAPVLSSQTGRALWIGNNPETFSFYPNQSIDLSAAAAAGKLSLQDEAELERISKNEIETSRWFAAKGVAFIRQQPWLTVRCSFGKLLAGFSWRLNPLREPLAQWSYFAFYVPVSILGPLGMFLARRRRETQLIGMAFVAFIGVTAVFWAHTSHRTYLDIYLIIFAASVLDAFRSRGESQDSKIWDETREAVAGRH
jgi:4-amino-4-deoxy-L-arabinose transferase-like glycosyltransferase